MKVNTPLNFVLCLSDALSILIWNSCFALFVFNLSFYSMEFMNPKSFFLILYIIFRYVPNYGINQEFGTQFYHLSESVRRLKKSHYILLVILLIINSQNEVSCAGKTLSFWKNGMNILEELMLFFNDFFHSPFLLLWFLFILFFLLQFVGRIIILIIFEHQLWRIPL